MVLPERAGPSRSAETVYLWPALPLRFVGMGGDRGWRWVILSSSPLDFANKKQVETKRKQFEGFDIGPQIFKTVLSVDLQQF